MTCAIRVSTPTAQRADVRRFAVGDVVVGGATCAAESGPR